VKYSLYFFVWGKTLLTKSNLMKGVRKVQCIDSAQGMIEFHPSDLNKKKIFEWKSKEGILTSITNI